MDFKIVPVYLIRHDDLCPIIIKALDGLVYFHFLFLVTGHKINCIHIVFLGAETEHYFFPGFWFFRVSVISGSIAKQGIFIQYRPHIQDVLHLSVNVLIFMIHIFSSYSKHMIQSAPSELL